MRDQIGHSNNMHHGSVLPENKTATFYDHTDTCLNIYEFIDVGHSTGHSNQENKQNLGHSTGHMCCTAIRRTIKT